MNESMRTDFWLFWFNSMNWTKSMMNKPQTKTKSNVVVIKLNWTNWLIWFGWLYRLNCSIFQTKKEMIWIFLFVFCMASMQFRIYKFEATSNWFAADCIFFCCYFVLFVFFIVKLFLCLIFIQITVIFSKVLRTFN